MALTLNRGGAKEIIRLNFNVSKLRQEITGIYKTNFPFAIHFKGKVKHVNPLVACTIGQYGEYVTSPRR